MKRMFRVPTVAAIVGVFIALTCSVLSAQTQPYQTFISGIQIQPYQSPVCKISFNVTANNGGSDEAPAGSPFIVYIYNEGGELYNQCSGQLQPAGYGKCYAEIALNGGYLDVYYNGVPNSTPPYAPSQYLNFQFGGGGSCGN